MYVLSQFWTEYQIKTKIFAFPRAQTLSIYQYLSFPPVDHVEPVAVLDGGDDLAEVLPGCVLAEAALVAHDVVVHVASVRELQHEVEAGLGVDHLIEAHLQDRIVQGDKSVQGHWLG